jgi:hypothetical protein
MERGWNSTASRFERRCAAEQPDRDLDEHVTTWPCPYLTNPSTCARRLTPA